MKYGARYTNSIYLYEDPSPLYENVSLDYNLVTFNAFLQPIHFNTLYGSLTKIENSFWLEINLQVL